LSLLNHTTATSNYFVDSVFFFATYLNWAKVVFFDNVLVLKIDQAKMTNWPDLALLLSGFWFAQCVNSLLPCFSLA
jgi:hypothetical protein